jgi:hypothetical protein
MRRSRAGRSARARFSQLRRENLRRQWREWLGVVLVAVTGIAIASLSDGAAQLIGAWMVGFACAVAVAGWLLAFDAHALPWLWGSVGEELSAKQLGKLGAEWHVVHDIPTPQGNWDHVVVGPPGLFLLDSKNLRGHVVAYDDALTAGSMRLSSRNFRGAAFGLSTLLKQRLGSAPWVQAVVVVWGDFPQRLHHGERVVFVAGDHLLEWLQALQPSLPATRLDAVAGEIADIAQR